MNAAAIFSVVNVLPLPIWAIWMAAPRSQLARTLARSLLTLMFGPVGLLVYIAGRDFFRA